MFHVGDVVEHVKGGRYVILREPIEWQKMEYCNETYYEYQLRGDVDSTFWIRSVSEMEDGRFTKVGDVNGV
jgi:hypothetical protein